MMPYNNDIAPCTNSPSSMTLVSNWFKECTKKHSECGDIFSKTSFMPSRLIEIRGVTEAYLKARLRERHHLSGDTRYSTLSHCWGSTVPFKLLSDNRNALLEEIPIADLSKVFRDAIVVAWRLGFHYIWIDSLCKPVLSILHD